MTILTHDPRDGTSRDTDITPTPQADVRAAADRAAAALRQLRDVGRAARAAALRGIADALEADRADLVACAMAETGLGEQRLTGEVNRSAFQFRMFADAIEEGSYLEAMIDHAGDTPLGPAPDVRRMLVPLGPVAVFGSSNFPFAFSVAGGDTASALAAGNPVVVKAHSSHILTSRATFDVIHRATVASGLPTDTFQIVYGQQAGVDLVRDPAITAVGYTGSLGAAQILIAAIGERETPIPFYGELSSVNPLIVTEAAARARGAQIAQGLYTSVTGSAGQLCTKPGVAFVPRTDDAIVPELVRLAAAAEPQPLLNAKIHESLFRIQGDLIASGGASALRASEPVGPGLGATPGVLEIDASTFTAAAAEEAFGPVVVVVRYDTLDELPAALDAVPDSLTATVHCEADEAAGLADLVTHLQRRSGRVVFNGYPTGVRVCWAQHHGGPWPATNSQHTSVGVTAMRRFLRPIAWQSAPAVLLPAELRDDDASVPRRVDGVYQPAKN
ncbi:MAG: aldehyde dehydrogenase (NADP(+)) [Actinobacteria bacterium 69-20]|nr:aldehyde dehydrogenase family protein [Actinomycetota bacterium]OJV24902.1 MAG: aldehyde dehydrogenase (NADP(+)) [Actinobacteria bacterium 69-20]